MGVKDFFKIFPCYNIQHQKDLKGLRIGVDVSYDIYRASLGMKNIDGLTDTSGNPTILLNVLLQNISKYKKLSVAGIIYIFDNPEPNPLKLEENKRRKAIKDAVKTKVKNMKEHKINDEKTSQIEKRTFSISKEMINDIKKLLNFMNIPWIVAPKNFEAEHLGAEMMKKGIITTLMTSDSDTLMFGGKSIMRKTKIKSKVVYEEYRLHDILTKYNIEYSDLIKIGVVMGNDFNSKTKGVGVKTVLKKIKDIKLTDEQKTSYDYFMSVCPYEDNDIYRSEKPDYKGLVKWLVDEKNFSEQRVNNTLKPFLK